MKAHHKTLSALLLLALLSLLSGCMSAQKDSSIPWSRPADWEGQIPGMTSSGVTR